MRIRSRLMTLVVATLLPACLAAGAGIVYVYRTQQESNWRSMRETARALSRLMENQLDASRQMLQTMAEAPAFQDRNVGDIRRYVTRMGDKRHINFLVLDITGHAVASSVAQEPAEAGLWAGGFRPGPPEEHQPDVSALYYSSYLKGLAYSLRVPVSHEGQLLYVLQAEIPALEMQRMVEQQSLPARWLGTVIDSNSVIVARSRDGERFAGTNVTGGMRSKLHGEDEGSNVGRSLSGELVNAYFSRMPLSGWAFVVSVPQEEWNDPALRAALLTGLALALILGIGVLAALVLARSVARPIEALRAAAIEVGQGGNPRPMFSGIVELDDVARELRTAGATIRSGEARLHERVTQAVAETERSQRALLQAQKMESLGRLTGGIAHDFNNVLQTLTSGLQIAMHASDNARMRDMLGACERALHRAVELTRQLRNYGQAQETRLVSLDPRRHLESLLPLLRGALPAHVELALELHPSWPVTVDPLQLELALLNLTLNARDAMPKGGRLTLALQNVELARPPDGLQPGQYVRLELTDTGHGMTQDVVSRALDPFFTTKAVGAGSGLGLPQAFGFARQSGGTLLLQSQFGRGTRVIILLPRCQLTVVRALPAQKSKASVSTAGARLLFVEDDPELRTVVVHGLAAHGFEVTVATTADEALERLQEASFDLVFSDIVMPGSMNGIALARIVRRDWPRTHVVLATGYSRECANLDGVRLLGKPYAVSDLVEVLSEELQQVFEDF